MVPLLLYADELILMPENAAGLQKQLNALASFCEQRQLIVNVSKTKVVVFQPQRSDVSDFFQRSSDRLHTSHFTLHTSHFMLHTSHFTLHTSHFTLHASDFRLQTAISFLGGSCQKGIGCQAAAVLH